MQVDVISPAVQEELREIDLSKVLFLEKHPRYNTHYLVESFDPIYVYDLKEVIGEYRSVFMFKVDHLRDVAEEKGYERLIYLHDPSEVLEKYSRLEDSYPYPFGVDLKRFQIQGFNYCKDLQNDIITWSTGTGKTIYSIAKAKHLLETGKVDKVVVVSKSHNKINWKRQFKDVGFLEAEIAEAPGNTAALRRERRTAIYNSSQIFIINYEKLRLRPKKTARSATGDGQEIAAALKKQNVYFIYDEMPTKLKNQSTVTWKGIKRILKDTKFAYQTCLSATPLDNSPEDIYNCVKLMDPKIFGSLSKFRAEYAKTFNPFIKWQVDLWDVKKLQEMGMRLAHMTHTANKYRDPEIRAEFPEEHWEDIVIDMSPEDRVLYDQVEKKLITEMGKDFDILPRLHVLQTICSNPLWLELSNSKLAQAVLEKKKVTDKFSAKLETLKEMLEVIEGKVVLFSMYNEQGAQQLAKYIQEWGHSYVLYNGNEHQLQLAEDKFRQDGSIKVFISSDRGSDSINLEQAVTVINYDLPYKYSTLLQRVNRINRITSTADHVWYYNLIVADSMEERKKEILDIKKALHEALEDPSVEHSEAITGLTKQDYLFILTGKRD